MEEAQQAVGVQVDTLALYLHRLPPQVGAGTE